MKSSLIQPIIWSAKAFGTGVILSTGFVHLLGEAGEKLETLSEATQYDAWPYVIAQVVILMMAIVDFMATSASVKREGCDHPSSNVDLECRHSHGHSHAQVLYNDKTSTDLTKIEEQKRKAAVCFLEAGILSHSVLIGIDMGVSSGNTFDALLIAISFHQFFEGFALAQVVLEANFASVWPILLTAVGYSLTTSLGISIGIGLHTGYSENSSFNLAVGILDSVSGGILVYLGILLLLQWFAQSRRLASSSRLVAVISFISIALGSKF